MKRTHFFILLGILVLSLILRLVFLADIPPGLNRDEASIGYTAYSVLKTARDEHGIFLPISLKSFGDWKLPIYVYATVPFVAIFGLIDIAVRLPSVVAGVLTVLLVYLIAKKLFDRQRVAIIAALVLAISPWHIFFSRVASEANLATFFVTFGFYCFLTPFKRGVNYILGVVLFFLSLLTYHGHHVFTPLFFVAICIFVRNEFQYRRNWVALGFFLFGAVFIFGQTLLSADKTKISGLLSLNDPSLVHENIVKNRLIFKNQIVAKTLFNKGVYFVENVAQNYMNSFSPNFLFFLGGGNMQHNIPDFGNLYLVEAPFLVFGIYLLFVRREKSASLLLTWMLIAPVGAALTKDAPHSARSFTMVIATTLMIAYGIDGFLGQKKQKIAVVGVILLYLVNVGIFLPRYFTLFPYKRYAAWGKAYHEMVQKIAQVRGNYQEVVVSRPDYSPYIYYLFYQRSDPRDVQRNLIYYPPTPEGFEHVQFYDGVRYRKIDWTDELLLPGKLYVDWTEAIPNGATNSAILITPDEYQRIRSFSGSDPNVGLGDTVVSRIVDEVLLPDGKPFLRFIETYLIKAPTEKL